MTPDSWVAVLLGQRMRPTGFDPVAATLPIAESADFMAHLRDIIARAPAVTPSHKQFDAQYCAASRTPAS